MVSEACKCGKDPVSLSDDDRVDTTKLGKFLTDISHLWSSLCICPLSTLTKYIPKGEGKNADIKVKKNIITVQIVELMNQSTRQMIRNFRYFIIISQPRTS